MFTYLQRRFWLLSACFCLVLALALSSLVLADEGEDNIVYLPVVVQQKDSSDEANDLDTTFGGDGRVRAALAPSNDSANDLLIQPDGKLVVAGTYYIDSTNTAFALTRYNANGSLDLSFGGNGRVGRVITDFWLLRDSAQAVALQPDGKIVAAGTSWDNFAVARYNSDGSLDTSFDGDGKLTTDLGVWAKAHDILVQLDGKIVVAGTVHNGDNTDFGLVRYNLNGSLDTSFGADGKVTTDFGDTMEFGDAAVMQPNGKIVVVGAEYGGNYSMARYNTDGSLDTSFDGDGMVTGMFGELMNVRGLLQQADGKLVLVGDVQYSSTGYLALVRYHIDGSLDITFGVGGLATANFGAVDVVAFGRDGVVQPDGKIVAVGGWYDEVLDEGGIALARYNPDGSLDSTFDSDGKVKFDYQSGSLSADAVTRQADGKLVLAGQLIYDDVRDFALVRYNTDGSLDTNFGAAGVATTDIGADDFGHAAVLQPDGKLVMAGQRFNEPTDRIQFAITRFLADGRLDTSFSGDGMVGVGWIGDAYGYAVALQPDGKVVVAGEMDTDFGVARLTVLGELDNTFSGDGRAYTHILGYDVARAVVIQPDGKIVAVGYTTLNDLDDFALVRYNSDGVLDTTFSGDGKQTTDFFSYDDVGRAVARQADGKLLVAGYASTGTQSNFALARYNVDGSLDNTFSGDGKETTDFMGKDDFGQAVVLQPDGKIIVVGYAHNGTNDDFALARYKSDGSLDTSFGGDGKVMTDSGLLDQGQAVALLADGRILVAGYSGTSRSDFVLLRYNSDGSLDTNFGVGGKLVTDFCGYRDVGQAVLVQSDGKVIVAGYTFDSASYDFAALRYK